MRWVVNATPPATLPPGKNRYPLYRRLGRPQERSGRVRKISPPTGIRFPDRPAHSEWLYRLSYPGRWRAGRTADITALEQLIVKMASVSRIVWMDSCNVDDTAGDIRAQYLPSVCRCHLLYRLNQTICLDLGKN
jgi:hypothetical protein